MQCDQVASHYELNANIYDYNWESKRSSSGQQQKANKISPKRSIDSELEMLKRMGELKDRAAVFAANESNDSAMLTTTLSPLDRDDDNGDDDGDDNFSGSVTTIQPNSALFTETVFGSRSAKKSSSIGSMNDGDAEMLKKIKRAGGGVKGGGGSASAKLAKFNRLNSLSSGSAKSSGKSANLAAAGNTASSSFFSRYKYASHHSMTEATTSASPKSAKLQQQQQQLSRSAALSSAPNSVASAFRSRQHSLSSTSSSSLSSSSHLPFTSHLSSSSSLHRPKHYRA